MSDDTSTTLRAEHHVKGHTVAWHQEEGSSYGVLQLDDLFLLAAVTPPGDLMIPCASGSITMADTLDDALAVARRANELMTQAQAEQARQQQR